MNRWLISLSALLVAGLASTASAQQPGRCEILSGEVMDVLDRGTARERVVLSGNARIGCDGGIELEADTAISHSVTGMRRFIGHVVYTDSTKSLVADRVDYDAGDERLHARGGVILTDGPSGSVIRGDDLDYRRESPERPLSIAVITGGRPHATLHRTAGAKEPAHSPRAVGPVDSVAPHDAVEPTAEDTVDAAPLEVDADRMELHGEHLFRAHGRAELEHGETQAFAEMVEYDQLDDRILLTGEARVEDESFTLLAERIEAFLQDEELREVFAEQDGVLLAEELRVEAPTLRMFLEDGEAERMIAVRPSRSDEDQGEEETEETEVEAERDMEEVDPAARAEPDTVLGDGEEPQPIVVTADFWLTADSIDALSPGQRLQEVIAVGAAYGEQIASEAGASDLPEGVARDWLSGDTITAYFIEMPAADTVADAEDSDEPRITLERLVSVGPDGWARSVYRMQEDDQAPGDLSINFMVADRITLRFREGEVVGVDADGPLHGLHLQPKPERRSEEEAGDDSPATAESNGT